MKIRYKVVRIDSFARDIIADKVVCENLGPYEADRICERLISERYGEYDPSWYVVRPMSAQEWRGREEFV